jgi:hypothetical protein
VTGLPLAVALVVAGAALQAAPPRPAAGRDVCDLLAAEDIRSVQQSALAQKKGSEDRRNALTFSQCVFATRDFVRSVSLSVISGSGAGGARSYWEATFRSTRPPLPATARRAAAPKKKDPPRAIAGTGDEAFWTGDSRSGALYVLDDGVVLRISVGGVTDEEERIRRSTALVQAALRRLGEKHP